MSQSRLGSLVDDLRAGKVSRRQFMQGATALGVGTAAATLIANTAIAQSATPGASPAASPAAGATVFPDAGTDGQTRGVGGDLRILQSQAPTVLAPHSSTGSKDVYAGNLVLEPMMIYLADGSLGAVLLDSVPSVEAGTLKEDLSGVTLVLKEGLLWSDGTPVTSKDIEFTWKWVTTPENASVNVESWGIIKSIELPDDRTAVVTFTSPQVAWFECFTAAEYGVIYPSHAFNDDPTNKNDNFLVNPIGTGPFKVDSFSPNDQATFVANENYRDANKPFFSRVVFKGGGDSVSAGRAVVQTGEYDYAWNVQAEPAIIQDIEANATTGKILESGGSTVEAIYVQFADPNKEVNGQRSEANTPNPVLSDLAVRQAIQAAIQRDLIAGEFYGVPDNATANILAGNPFFNSPNTSWEFNTDKANQILDDAGWAKDGDTRKKDGVELKVSYASAINQVRQKTQAVVKKNLEAAGFKVELVEVDTAVFFDSSPGADQNNQHFYWDLAMWSSGPSSSIPVKFVNKWYADGGKNFAQKENSWQGRNVQRWNSPDFDKLYDELVAATTSEEASRILIAMNDLIVEQAAVIPLVLRVFYNAVSSRLREENVGNDNPNATPYWNIANWNLAEGQ
ncbi:MAG: peptide ABC transporter substrate-binding protein [Thermomicrobiales bacterium]